MLRTLQIGINPERVYKTQHVATKVGTNVANQLTGAVNVIVMSVETAAGIRYTPVFCCFQIPHETIPVANMGFQVFA